MKKDKIKIRPLNPIYIVIYVIVIAFILLSVILPFWLLINNKPINFFDLGYINEGYIQFLIVSPISGFLIYIFIRTGIFSFKVSFNETHIIIPKISEIQKRKIEIECNQILTCEPIMKGFYYYFSFYCADEKKRKMFITRFSLKQLKRILELIKERDGLQDQDIDEIMYPLRITKRKKK